MLLGNRQQNANYFRLFESIAVLSSLLCKTVCFVGLDFLNCHKTTDQKFYCHCFSEQAEVLPQSENTGDIDVESDEMALDADDVVPVVPNAAPVSAVSDVPSG